VRARDWHRAVQAAVCDVIEPWAHGTVLRASRYPSYYDFNNVRVERDPGMSAEALAAFAEEAMAGLRHRRVDFEQVDVGEPLRAGFAELGWLTHRLVWMRHEAPAPPGSRMAVEEVPYEAVHHLRVQWHEEDFPDVRLGRYLDEAREVAGLLGARVLAIQEAGTPVAFAQVDRLDRSTEIAQVYVQPGHRGRGLGTALTRAAIDAAGEVDDLWIVADDEGRPKHMYARLGFRPLWRAVELLRLPRA
jgi:ribosomal protein S18 acetylase RimI-like enzyme